MTALSGALITVKRQTLINEYFFFYSNIYNAKNSCRYSVSLNLKITFPLVDRASTTAFRLSWSIKTVKLMTSFSVNKPIQPETIYRLQINNLFTTIYYWAIK